MRKTKILPLEEKRQRACEATRKYYERNAEKIRAKKREQAYQYYLKNPARKRQQNRSTYRRHRKERILHQREYDAKHKLERKTQRIEWYTRHREEQLAKGKRYNNTHRYEISARNKARWNIPLKPTCENCGTTENLEHHHPDYSEPLETITLCKACHIRLHKGVLEILA